MFNSLKLHRLSVQMIQLIFIFACCTSFVQQAIAFSPQSKPSIFSIAPSLPETDTVRLPEKRPWFKTICISKVGINITKIPDDMFKVYLQGQVEGLNWDAVEQQSLKKIRNAFLYGKGEPIPYFSEEINEETHQVDRLLSPFTDSLNAQLGPYLCTKKGNTDSSFMVDGLITCVRLFQVKNSHEQIRYKAKIYTSWIVREDEKEEDGVPTIDTIRTCGYSMLLPTAEDALSNGVFSSFTQLFTNEVFMHYLWVDTATKVTDTFNISVRKAERMVSTLDEALQATVSIRRNDGRIGTGFAINHEGYLLTSSNLVFNQKKNRRYKIMVVLPTGQELPAQVIRVDTAQNVALVHCDTTFNYAYALPEVKNYDRLEDVYVIGTPGTLELEHTINHGMISGERKLDGKDILQLNINTNLGNEGGPVMNKESNLNGLIISKLIGPTAEGVSFAIPAYRIVQYLHITIHP